MQHSDSYFLEDYKIIVIDDSSELGNYITFNSLYIKNDSILSIINSVNLIYNQIDSVQIGVENFQIKSYKLKYLTDTTACFTINSIIDSIKIMRDNIYYEGKEYRISNNVTYYSYYKINDFFIFKGLVKENIFPYYK